MDASESRFHKWALSRPGQALSWIFRILTGATFIASGFTKAVDPWGTIYKIEDYLAVMGLDIFHSLIVIGAFLLCGIEFIVGVMLLLGCYRRSIPIVAMCIMAVMLPLTVWIAIANPVPDCGCFGEAFMLSNTATLVKNIILTAMLVWLIPFNRHIHWIITPALQWIAATVSVVYIGLLIFIGYNAQPLIDFRPFKVGTELSNSEQDAEPDYIFIYEKDGQKREFGLNDTLPDEEDGWVFVDRKEVRSGGAGSAEDSSLHIFDRYDDTEEVTSEVINPDMEMMMLLIPAMTDMPPTVTYKINSLYDWAEAHNVGMIAIAAGTEEEISRFEDLSMPEYPIYIAEDTVIKEIARGNPAVVFLKDGKIVWKTSLKALDFDDFMTEEIDLTPETLVDTEAPVLSLITWPYILALAILTALGFSRKIKWTKRVPKVEHTDSESYENNV